MQSVATPSDARRRQRGETIITAIVVGAIAALHAAGTWGHVTVFWGDYGYMMDLVERAHDGLVPYRDFHWAYPPLGIWVFGAATRLGGIDLAGVWAVTSLIYALIIAAFVWYVRLVAPHGMQAAVAGVGVLLAVAIANFGSAPLPLGTYSPAGPIGFLCILLAWCAALTFVRRPTAAFAMLASTAAGLAVLAKHDYWIAAAYVVVVCAWHAAARRDDPRRWPLVAATAAPAALVVVTGSALIVAQTDAAMLLDIVRGFGLVSQQANRGAATLEILTIEVVILAGLFAVLSLAVQSARPAGERHWRLTLVAIAVCSAGMLLWLGQAYRIGSAVAAGHFSGDNTQLEGALANIQLSARSFLRFSADALTERGLRHVLPALLPFGVAAAFMLGWPRRVPPDRRRWLLLLVGFAITLRARRQFEFTEWFSVMVEIPLYAAALVAWLDGEVAGRRAVLVGCALYAGVGLVAYHQLGRGMLTARGVQPAIETPRGTYRAASGTLQLYRDITSTVDALDPSGRRPVFGYGYTNGYNYFTGRPYPKATPIGFRSTSRSRPDSTVRAVLASAPAAIVIDNPFYDVSMYPKPGVHLARWALPFEHPPHNAQMRAAFGRIIERCRLYRRIGTGPNAFAVYDCAGAAPLGAPMGTR